ncbi:hypothetical protein DBR36_15865 [Microbacterium sp. HMWF026]|uniref:hypothetical protein n=1 Tax=Microbacterium sp. HMWF026 TaxID=2056861 RepID=UPI000D43074A|nr:hypothetical protein [Microbacterium sp. HMWF026]PTT14649.1 hypothetical protein DBR36_15865 [Microbacterium sp. HMWF026]
MATKEVRFYDTWVVQAATATKPLTEKRVKATFWMRLLDKLEEKTDPKDRTTSIRGNQFYGQVVRPTAPAINHLQVGRLRDRSEHIEQTDLVTGTVAPLVLSDNLRVSEPTFVVPFGSGGRVAVMSPGRSTRAETIGNWLTLALGYVTKGKSIELRPVIDDAALERLLNSEGAVGVEFHLDSEEEIATDDDGDGGIPLLDAVENLRAEGPQTGTLMVGWSLGIKGGSAQEKNQLKRIAAKFKEDSLARRIKVNMVVENEDGDLRRETHDLMVDKITKKANWKTHRDKRSTTEEILVAMSNAVQEFNNTPGV